MSAIVFLVIGAALAALAIAMIAGNLVVDPWRAPMRVIGSVWFGNVRSWEGPRMVFFNDRQSGPYWGGFSGLPSLPMIDGDLWSCAGIHVAYFVTTAGRSWTLTISTWYALLPSLACLALAATRLRGARRAAGACTACGHPLRDATRCPECGNRVGGSGSAHDADGASNDSA